ncbi:helix-turn-helix domain-containing protein [Mucilaginibacter sp. X4EP1]|uniref:helix-turn-helix domain-containing protein n=1 Tax=Mucilaginibacter sp. X4EP1 TaxID=2723092 RepID=UPI0021693383|nr:helix-turn-helix domain-containing protein [Mucilaginibacter sp. X4EP1]MCS3811518.1 AraC-like DNA-binding protein [Mucilaginibacter sp. X4EP1]
MTAFNDFFISYYKDEETRELLEVNPFRSIYFEVIWVQAGSGVHTIDFIDYPFDGPCLFLLNPQNIRTLKKDCVTSGGVIKFTPSFFAADSDTENFILNYGVFDDIDVLPVIKLKKEEAFAVKKAFEDIYQEYERDSLFSDAILLSFLKIFLLKVYEIKKSYVQINCFKSPDYIRFKSFERLLDCHYKKIAEVSFYAESLAVSTKTLTKVTQKFTGKTPGQLIKDRILLESKRMLHFSNLSIKEIAHAIGFDDSSYFTRFFKKNTNASPGSYRNKSQ